MKKRIDEKIKEIEAYLSQLIVVRPKSLKKYLADFKSKAACERYFERISDSILDLALLVLKDIDLNPPDDGDCLEILKEENIIDFDLAKKLKEMKGMRNIIAHQYGSIDDEIVYSEISKELENDVKNFLILIRKFIEKEELLR